MDVCSKHGEEGNPKCPECWSKLGKLLSDNNVRVIGTKEDLKKLRGAALK